MSELFPAVDGHHVAILTVERIAVVALIVILLDAGMHVGWPRFRSAALPITALGIVGTTATAALVAVIAHGVLGFGWTTAWILGAALAPTDPAVMFSVLGNREIRGRSGTILEGESGVNDPVGIALVIGIVEYATHGDATAWTIAGEVGIELGVGLAVGVVGGLALVPLMQRVSLPREGFYPLMVLAVAGVVYGLASILHGSGFLAVFLAGLVDRRHSRTVQERDRAVPHLAREPRRDRRLRRARPDRRPGSRLRRRAAGSTASCSPRSSR